MTADEEAVAYAGSAPIITDDRTRLDFTVARSLESFFGLSNANMDDWLMNLMSADIYAPQRAKVARMCSYKRSVLKHLTNGKDPVEGRAQLEAQLEARIQAATLPCIGSSTAKAGS